MKTELTTAQLGHPGDLIHGDRNGVQRIPLEIASQVPGTTHKIMRRRQRLIALCRSADFSLDVLCTAIHEPESKS
jgi:regulator of RNase E activity RraA